MITEVTNLFQLATSCLTLTDAVSSFLFLKKTMSEDISCGRGKDVSLFQKGEITGLHQEKKTIKEIGETA